MTIIIYDFTSFTIWPKNISHIKVLSLLSSYNHLEEIQADKKTAMSLIDIFCTITATKDYDSSSLVKIENYQISYDLLMKLLKRTVCNEITLTSE
jgi:hypothetical protein